MTRHGKRPTLAAVLARRTSGFAYRESAEETTSVPSREHLARSCQLDLLLAQCLLPRASCASQLSFCLLVAGRCGSVEGRVVVPALDAAGATVVTGGRSGAVAGEARLASVVTAAPDVVASPLEGTPASDAAPVEAGAGCLKRMEGPECPKCLKNHRVHAYTLRQWTHTRRNGTKTHVDIATSSPSWLYLMRRSCD
mmetsp:Transcript_110435/g.293364  ORF Transcript_110435/g.293364 Transcript_110435/m.293364 type:complete len:196 (-) Transcript_110435:15-602(-)